MNRYSSITTSEFNPLSFNELAAAPTMMRQKHDNSIAQAEAMRIKADPLDVHLNRAVELKRQMDNEIAKNVDILNKEGYNPTTFQNITKLNRQYQDLISPTGEIGQINAAKTIYNTNQEEFIKDAAKQNIGRDRAIDLWKEKTNYYTGFGDDRKSITNVSPQGVAAYQDFNKDLQVSHSLLGKTIQGLSSSGHHLEPDGNGGFWEVTKNNKYVKNENTKQVESARKAFLDKWDASSGEGKKWLMDSGEGVDRNRIINSFDAMLETSNIRDNSETANYNKPDISGDKNGTSATPLISVQNSIESKEFANQKYSDNLSAYKQMRSIPEKNMSEEQKVKMNMLETLIKGVDGDLVRTKAYINNKPIVDRFEKSIPKEYLNIVQNANHMSASEYDKEISKIAEQEFKKSSPGSRFIETRRGSTHINVRNKVDELVNKRRELYKPITDAKNTLTNLNNKKFYHYSLAPISEKEQGQYKNLSNALEGVVKDSGPSGLRNLGLIESVDMGDGSKRYKLTSNDRDQIQSLITNSEPGSVRLVSVSEKGPSGKPQLRIAFKVGKKSTDKDLSGWSLNPFNKSSDNLPEEGEEAFINVAFNSLNNIKNGGPGVKKITGLITNYLSERGEVTEEGSTEGYDLAKAIINNAYNVNN